LTVICYIEVPFKAGLTVSFFLHRIIYACVCSACMLQEACNAIFSSPDPKGHVSYCHHWASIRPLTFHILINSSEATRPIWTTLWWNGPWVAPFQNFVRWFRLPAKMAAKLKIEKRGDEILIVHCCFSISQNELKY
jgi:hypothetical protein